METTTIIRIVAGLLFICILVIGIIYIASLGRTLSKCSPASRTMDPGMVWLLLIPLFNLVWNFMVVIAISKSLANEFRLRNVPYTEPEPGQSIGIAMSVCAACGIIPFINFLAAPAQIVLWIIYWSKISGFSRRLDEMPAAQATLGSLPRA